MKSTISNPSSKMSIMKSYASAPHVNRTYGGSNGKKAPAMYTAGTRDGSVASTVSAQLRAKYKRK